MPYVDRTVFTTNDQSSGDVADPNKLEANDSHIADVVDANYKELYDFVNSENISKLGIVNVKDYGAIGDGTTDDTTAFQNALNENKPVYIPPGEYKITQKLTSTNDNFVLIGQGVNDSILLFDATDGVELTQTEERDSYIVQSLAFVTNANSLHTAFKYIGGSSTGSAVPRGISNCVFIGEDRREKTGSPYTQTWNVALDITQGDKTLVSECLFQGAESDRSNGFPNANTAIKANDSTHFWVKDTHIQIFNTSIEVLGQSENFYSHNNDLVANNYGINVNTDTDPSNDHNIIDTHISSYTKNIKMNTDSTLNNTSMHNIRGCLFFKRADSTNSFTHIELTCNHSNISGNYFYTSSSVDTVASGDVGVDIIQGEKIVVDGNRFNNQATLVRLSINASDPTIVNNISVDTPSTLSAQPFVDNGATNPMFIDNSGDRDFDFINTKRDINFATSKDQYFHTGSNRNLSFKILNGASTVANYIETYGGATGSPATLRANGTDTDIDFKLNPKGAGKIRFGSHTTTSDVPISGYIEVKDSSGTIRKLAVID